MSYSFILQPYKGRNSRFTCPSCKQPNQFTRYINYETKEYLADNVGICNRANKCSYHYPPKHYFNDNPNPDSSNDFARAARPTQPQPACPVHRFALAGGPPERMRSREPPSFINPQLFQKTITNHNQNNLINYLDTIFDSEIVDHLINIYKIGTSSYYNGGTTIFWQIDKQGQIRTGKLIKYDPQTGKRIKKPMIATNWFHAIHYEKSFNLCQCLFGEHLLAEYTNMPIAIVESEKTAIIAQAKMPDYLWMATGSLNEFKPSKLNILNGRRVVAFPDLGAYDYWLKKASLIDFPIEVSNYLEKNATEEQRKEGMDIGDFL